MKKLLLIATAAATLLAGQHKPDAKSYTLKGKVTEVGKDVLTVNHDKVEGYMSAMTMPYKVDKVDILKKVKTGDQIEATVYDDDYTLYNIKVVPAPAAGKSK